jgi:hypothetical protein
VAAHKPRPRPQTPTLTATPKPHHHHQTAKILKFLNGGSKNFEFVMKEFAAEDEILLAAYAQTPIALVLILMILLNKVI